jgi:hypothetical protein
MAIIRLEEISKLKNSVTSLGFEPKPSGLWHSASITTLPREFMKALKWEKLHKRLVWELLNVFRKVKIFTSNKIQTNAAALRP